MADVETQLNGRCLCGAVRFSATPKGGMHACHCEWIYIDAKPANYAFAGDRTRMTGAEVEALYAGG